MSRLGRGDSQALGEIYVRYASVVRAALTRSAPELPRAQREELTQDVFLALLESARRYRDEERLKAFLYGISVRKARMWRRQTWLRRHLLQRNEGRPIAMAPAQEGSPAQLTEAREDICQALEQLPESQREVLLLHAEGFSGDEIASLLQIRPKTVWTRLHRARSVLLAVAVVTVAIGALFSQTNRKAPSVARGPAATQHPASAEQLAHKAKGQPSAMVGEAISQSTASEAASAHDEPTAPARQELVQQGTLNVRTAASAQAAAETRETMRERLLASDARRAAEQKQWRAWVIDGRLAEAERGLRTHLEHSDRDAVAWSLLGDCLRKQERFREAVDAYRNVIRLGTSAEANRARFLAASLLQDRLQDPRSVIELLEAYGEDQAAAPEARLRLSRALLAVGERKRARSLLEAVLATHPASSIAAEARRLLDGLIPARP